MSRYYNGPVSDHFDGERFSTRAACRRGAGAICCAGSSHRRLRGTRAKWPDWAPSPYADRPPPRVEGAACRISYVGHASWLIQTAGLNILLDPVWSKRASPFRFVGPKRVNDPGIAFADLPPIDVVLVSHAHYDHLDVATLSRLAAAHRPRVITPLGNDTIMRNHDRAIAAEGYDWDDRVDLGAAAVTLVPTQPLVGAQPVGSQHVAVGVVRDRRAKRKNLCASPIPVTATAGMFRRARERHGPFRLAILPIGAYEPRWFMRDQHMNPAEAVQAYIDCGAELALAHHYGTFQLTDEAIDAPLVALADALKAAGIPAERFRALRPGEVVQL